MPSQVGTGHQGRGRPSLGSRGLVADGTSPSGAVLAEIIQFGENPVTGGLAPGNVYGDAPSAITRSYPAGGVQFAQDGPQPGRPGRRPDPSRTLRLMGPLCSRPGIPRRSPSRLR